MLSSQADPPPLGIPYSPTHAIASWQRVGFREAYGDLPRCSRLQGAASGVWNRGYIESFRKRKLSIGGDTLSLFENQHFLFVKPLLLA